MSLQVRLRKNETSESLVKRFLKKYKNSDILEEILERRYFKKPSTKRREQYFKRLAWLEQQKIKEGQSNE